MKPVFADDSDVVLRLRAADVQHFSEQRAGASEHFGEIPRSECQADQLEADHG